jgi:hypothetical protein
MAFSPIPRYTPAWGKWFPDSKLDQRVERPSSFVLVAKRIATAKKAMITGTTKKGEVMSMVLAP